MCRDILLCRRGALITVRKFWFAARNTLHSTSSPVQMTHHNGDLPLAALDLERTRADVLRWKALCLDTPGLRQGLPHWMEKKTLHLHLPRAIDADISKSIGLDDVNENKKQNKLHLRNCTNKISCLPCTGKQARYIGYVSIIC